MGTCVLYASRSPSLIYQMPQLFSNFTVSFCKFFTFTLEEKVFLYLTVTFFLISFSILTFSGACLNLSLGADVSCELHGMQTTLLFHQLPSGPDPSETDQQSLSCQVLSFLRFQSALCMNIKWGMSKSKPCTAWIWKYPVKWGWGMDKTQKNGPEALGLSKRQTEETSFIFLCLLRDGCCLASQKGCWVERLRGMNSIWLSSAALYCDRRSTGSRSTNKIPRPSLEKALPDKENCLKMFISDTWYTVWRLAGEGQHLKQDPSETGSAKWPAEICSSRDLFCSGVVKITIRALHLRVFPLCAGSLVRGGCHSWMIFISPILMLFYPRHFIWF